MSMEYCIYKHNAASWDPCRRLERTEKGELKTRLYLLASLYKQFKRHQIF